MTCDILDDPKIEQLTGDEFRMFVNILAALARSGSRDGTIELGPRALCRLACKHQTRHAEPIARRLADVGLTTSRRDGDVTLTTVPNWAKLQGFDCTNRVEKRREEKIEREPAATPPPDPDLISQSDITPTGPDVNTSDTSLELVADSAVFDPLPKYLEARESATSAKPTLWRAANQLSRYPGTRSERNAWVYENEDIIVTTALASGVATETAFHAKILELLHRYYRHEFVERKPRAPRFESFEKQKRREGDAFWDNLKANGYKLTGT
jgi:hypothetical protein